eukprot:1512463-Rhodomonas_salina.1
MPDPGATRSTPEFDRAGRAYLEGPPPLDIAPLRVLLLALQWSNRAVVKRTGGRLVPQPPLCLSPPLPSRSFTRVPGVSCWVLERPRINLPGLGVLVVVLVVECQCLARNLIQDTAFLVQTVLELRFLVLLSDFVQRSRLTVMVLTPGTDGTD